MRSPLPRAVQCSSSPSTVAFCILQWAWQQATFFYIFFFSSTASCSSTCVADLIFFLLFGPRLPPWTLGSLPETLGLVTSEIIALNAAIITINLVIGLQAAGLGLLQIHSIHWVLSQACCPRDQWPSALQITQVLLLWNNQGKRKSIHRKGFCASNHRQSIYSAMDQSSRASLAERKENKTKPQH